MRKLITVKESVLVNAAREDVWSFTQDFQNRQLWDHSVLAYEMVQKKPNKQVRISLKGGVKTLLSYKLCDRPNKTSLKMTETKGLFVKGGGGSWRYSDQDGQTQWVQVNSVELKHAAVYFLFGWFFKFLLRKNTEDAMLRAKSLIEKTA